MNLSNFSYPVLNYLMAFQIQIVQEWKFVSMVLDRFLLWVFTLSCIGGTLGIIFQSPSLYDTRKSLALELSEIVLQKHGVSSQERNMTVFDDPAL